MIRTQILERIITIVMRRGGNYKIKNHELALEIATSILSLKDAGLPIHCDDFDKAVDLLTEIGATR